MRGVVREQPDVFRVDLRVVGGGRLWPLTHRGWRVDPHVVATAVLALMDACDDRDARGRLLVWNRYRLFLSQVDYDTLRPLLDRLRTDLFELMQERLDKLGAGVVGPLQLDVLVAEDAPQASGTALVQVAFQAAAPVLHAPDATVRAGRYADEGTTSTTLRVAEPTGPSVTTLVWAGGSAPLAQGVRLVVGRPHQGSAGAFVPLHGAGPTVNKRQALVEPTAEGAIVGRLLRANPVQVNGQLVAPGSEI
ncbi:MAG: FhaA domain-containing protein [Myxococcota bacterium]